ncbi:DC1 [Dillenia turbinata]|uniref:DC1 n=1 Tax=Dillenia turbinata TaxID=194707 RepID=A0AAN8VIX0_9MAGN
MQQFVEHAHPMSVTDVKESERIQCLYCKQFISGPTFACFECRDENHDDGLSCCFYLHSSCALPRQMQHHFHPNHPLNYRLTASVFCNGCFWMPKEEGIVFGCKKCGFDLCLKCAFLMPTLNHPRHPQHPLTLVRILPDWALSRQTSLFIVSQQECDACGERLYFTDEEFCCRACGFDLHVRCASLKRTIQQTLSLTKSINLSLSDDYFCDHCEERRDPNNWTYSCTQCHFDVHISCVLSAVTCELAPSEESVPAHQSEERMQHSESNLNWHMTEEGTETGPSSDQITVYTSHNTDESSSKIGSKKSVGPRKTKASSKGKRGKGRSSRGTGTWKRGKGKVPIYVERLDEESTSIISKLYEFSLEDIDVGGHKVPKNLAPILEALLAKYGDFTTCSKVSPLEKSCLLVMLCATVHSMRRTRIVHASKEMLVWWWASLKRAQLAGFQVEFGFDHLKGIVKKQFNLRTEVTNSCATGEDEEIGNVTAQFEALEKLSSSEAPMLEERMVADGLL